MSAQSSGFCFLSHSMQRQDRAPRDNPSPVRTWFCWQEWPSQQRTGRGEEGQSSWGTAGQPRKAVGHVPAWGAGFPSPQWGALNSQD